MTVKYFTLNLIYFTTMESQKLASNLILSKEKLCSEVKMRAEIISYTISRGKLVLTSGCTPAFHIQQLKLKVIIRKYMYYLQDSTPARREDFAVHAG